MRWNKNLWVGIGLLTSMGALACSGTSQLVGSDNSVVTAPYFGTDAGSPVSYSFSAVLTSESPSNGSVACIPYALPEDANGNPSCQIASATQATDCSCNANGVAPADAALTQATRTALQLGGLCGPANGQIPCSAMCV
jgi:hypothetical protein